MFNCKFCGYSLDRKITPERCPYCSKERGMEGEAGAEELVEDT